MAAAKAFVKKAVVAVSTIVEVTCVTNTVVSKLRLVSVRTGTTVVTVSYTHLDVYKRQLLASMLILTMHMVHFIRWMRM